MYPEQYFQNLGYPRAFIGNLDMYRYKLISRFIIGRSVLDVGAYYGDFLKMIKGKYEVYGTDINDTRVELVKKNVGVETVFKDFKDGKLHKFNDKSIDTVICMEVIEHVYNDIEAIKELIRVAKSRVIITVPFDEKITKEVCIHCGKETPRSGHLHSYNLNSISKIEEENGIKFKKRFIGFKFSLANKFIYSFKNFFLNLFAEKILIKVFHFKPRWILLLFDTNL
jgi:ubiquinone/menaquinone biosynthesis C-methylase UbiE